jgi:hypothetical protein
MKKISPQSPNTEFGFQILNGPVIYLLFGNFIWIKTKYSFSGQKDVVKKIRLQSPKMVRKVHGKFLSNETPLDHNRSWTTGTTIILPWLVFSTGVPLNSNVFN